jgi:hypothetical protein
MRSSSPLILLAAALMGCASLIVRDDDPILTKVAKVTARVILFVPTLSNSEATIWRAEHGASANRQRQLAVVRDDWTASIQGARSLTEMSRVFRGALPECVPHGQDQMCVWHWNQPGETTPSPGGANFPAASDFSVSTICVVEEGTKIPPESCSVSFE